MPYRVIKKINGRRYVYLQESKREGKRVRTTLCQYLGPVDSVGGVGVSSITVPPEDYKDTPGWAEDMAAANGWGSDNAKDQQSGVGGAQASGVGKGGQGEDGQSGQDSGAASGDEGGDGGNGGDGGGRGGGGESGSSSGESGAGGEGAGGEGGGDA